jgi:hypothetical protein
VPVVEGVTLWLPEVPRLPLQAPLALQELALLEDQLSVVLCPRVIAAGMAPRFAVGAAAGLTLSVAEALLLPPGPVQLRV